VIRIRYANQEEREEYEEGQAPIAMSTSDNEIILFGKPTGVTLAHELAHVKLGHLDATTGPDSAEELVSDEIDAWLLTYKKLGRPKSLLGRFRGLVLDCYRQFGTPPNRTKDLIKVKLMSRKSPKRWLKELNIYEEEGRCI